MQGSLPTLRNALVCVLATSVVSTAGAQDIFKCVSEEGTAYQSIPCAPGAAEARIRTGAATSARTEVQTQAPPAPVQPLRRPGPWRHATLTVGMSDDEVLNLPGWGRPTRITRTRAPREWREEWVYGQATGGERYLYFANARLARIVLEPPVEQVARLAVR